MKIKKKWLITIPILVAVVIFVGLFYYYNREDENSFTVSEKKWIADNSSTVIDFNAPNDYPIFGESGVFRTFINDFSETTGLEFNIIPYLREGEVNSTGYRFRVLNSEDELDKNDLLLQEDVYILYGKDNGKYDSMLEATDKTIGVLTSDSDEIIYYLKSYSNLKYKTYDKSQDLFKDYEDKKVDLIIIPNNMYLDTTLLNDKYNIKYVFTELSKKIVLSLADNENNDKMNNIIEKYFNNWKEKNYIQTYNKTLLNYYISKANVNDKDKTEFLTKNYTYGFVSNLPYENLEKTTFSGIAAEYLNRMMRLTNSDFITFKEYDNLDDLKKAIDKGEVDIYFNYFDYEANKYNSTISPFIEKYVVLAKTSDKYVINSFEAMKGKKVSIIEDNSIYNYFKDNSKAKLAPCRNIKELLNNSDGNLIVVDRELYEYYRNNKFEDYEVLFESTITNDYKFMVNNDDTNKVFYDVFNYIIGTNSYYNYRNSGINSLNLSLLEKSTFEELYMMLLAIVLIPIIVLLVLYFAFKKTKKVKTIKKEERRKYTDMLTSLKNRNYLNHNIKVWNESQKYPQSIIIIDLNNIKYVNDNYGHEQGDELIIGAASILINTQLENSEIIRSDGNEFLLYLVGYSEQQISTYSKKLAKEFKSLPYGFGAAIGFSMINDEIKTIDDAINEATIEMRKDKEEYR
ncbi:MAG: GGDEF domain-containing protein [Bacilli bacterium]|nr:GGDEF domain-containing protein [Bacilli bacterium]